MDPQPGTSRQQVFLSPKKKRPKVALSATEKLMICNVYKYVFEEKSAVLQTEFESPKKTECVSKTAEILGISLATVYSVLKEYKENERFKSPQKTGPKHDFKDKLDDFTFAAIRRKVHQFLNANEAPTIAKVVKAVNDDSDLPNLSWGTMRKILKHLNIKYDTKSKKSIKCCGRGGSRARSHCLTPAPLPLRAQSFRTDLGAGEGIRSKK